MNRASSLLGFLVLSVGAAFAQPPSTPTPGPVDPAWEEIEKLTQPPASPQKLSRREMMQRRDRMAEAVQSKLAAYFVAHASDPQRWQAVVLMTHFTPSFITRFGDNFENDPADCTVDRSAETAFERTLARYRHALEAAPDVPSSVKEEYWSDILDAAIDRKSPDFPKLREQLATFAREFPSSSRIRAFVSGYMAALEEVHPDEVRSEWARLVDFPNAAVAERAHEKLRVFALLDQPLELAFTAADGRSVDVAKLRGKVVLVDFWATWCGPCVAEIPNVKRVYEQYHDRGFEVIGVSFENPRIGPTDSADIIAAKKDAAKQRLLQFAAAHGMTWPQQFDGLHWNNEFARKFAIYAIPATFLVDQNGRVVSTDARGAKLEAQVAQLLSRHP